MERDTKNLEQSGNWFDELFQSGNKDATLSESDGRAEKVERQRLERAKLKLRQRLSLDAMAEMLLIDSLLAGAPRSSRRKLVSVAEKKWSQYRQRLMIARISGSTPRYF